MVAPPPVFSDLFNGPTKWDEPTPDYGALILLLGGVASTAGGAPALCLRPKPNYEWPCKLGPPFSDPPFCPANDNDYIYVGHSISIYPTDPLVNLKLSWQERHDDGRILEYTVSLNNVP